MFLDYNRLVAPITHPGEYPPIDPALVNCLVSLSHQDEIRRAVTAFPEYFQGSPHKPSERSPVYLEHLIMRWNVLGQLDELQRLVDWFGLPLTKWEARYDEEPAMKGYHLLPAQINLGDDEEAYLLCQLQADQEPLTIFAPTKPGAEAQKFLVLEKQPVCIKEEGVRFLLHTVPYEFICQSAEIF